MTRVRRTLRQQATPAEIRLWQLLRRQQLNGFRFRRQHSVGSYVLDFYCVSAKLGIELDGAGHGTAEGRAYDAARDAWLTEMGLRVVRFQNWEVFRTPEAVLRQVAALLGSSSDLPRDGRWLAGAP